MFGKKEEPKEYAVDLSVHVYERSSGMGRISTSRTLSSREPLTLQQLGAMLDRLARAVDEVAAS